MLELCALQEFALLLIEGDDLDLVGGVLNVGAHRQPDVLLLFVAKVDRVDRPFPLVGVDLLTLGLLLVT